jgi:prophage regulatory protein
MPEQATNAILRLAPVKGKTGLGKTQIYELISRGEFPAQIKLSSRAVGWLSSDIDNWIADRVAASRNASGGAK